MHSPEAQDLPHLVLVNLARRDEPLLEHGLHVRELLTALHSLLFSSGILPLISDWSTKYSAEGFSFANV